jgi:hypothetical protein
VSASRKARDAVLAPWLPSAAADGNSGRSLLRRSRIAVIHQLNLVMGYFNEKMHGAGSYCWHNRNPTIEVNVMAHIFGRPSRLTRFFALALGLMALSASAAQGEPGAHWKINTVPVTDELNVQIQSSMENVHIILLTKVGLSKVEILCPKIKLVDMLLKTLGRLLGKIHYEECITKLNGSTANACVPHSPGAANGLWETEFIDGLIKLHEVSPGNKVDLIEWLDDEKPVFATLILGKGSPEKNECAIGEKFNLNGNFFWKDCQNELLNEKVTHLFEEGPLSAMTFGANPMTMDGSWNVSLIGLHAGMKWSGISG